MENNKSLLYIFTLVLGLVTGTCSNAAPITFQFVFSGASFGNTALAEGIITFEDTLLPNPGSTNLSTASPAILDLSVSVSGAGMGNGVFGLSDFLSVDWNTNGGALDFSNELVGQSTSGDPWGTQSFSSGEFNLISVNPSDIVSACFFFTLCVGFDSLNLVSMQAVPIPPALWLLGSGLVCLTGISRRRRHTIPDTQQKVAS